MDRDRLIELLRRRIESLERTASLGFLLSAVVHEVNNPLSVILIGADTVRQAGVAHSAVQRHLDVLETQSSRIIEISRRLQDMSRRNLSHRDEIDMRDLLELSSVLQEVLSGPDTCPRIELGDDPLPVVVNPEHMLQVLRYACCAARHIEAEGPLKVSASRQSIALITVGPAAERAPKRDYAVVALRCGEPEGKAVPYTMQAADFFGEDREEHEIDLMACWEILRKINGKLMVRGGQDSGIELLLMVPLVEQS